MEVHGLREKERECVCVCVGWVGVGVEGGGLVLLGEVIEWCDRSWWRGVEVG